MNPTLAKTVKNADGTYTLYYTGTMQDVLGNSVTVVVQTITTNIADTEAAIAGYASRVASYTAAQAFEQAKLNAMIAAG